MTVKNARAHAAACLHTSEWKLRRHMKDVGFDPLRPIAYEDVKHKVELAMLDPCCDTAGATFMETRLRTEFGLVARKCDVSRALRELDPHGTQRRAKDAAKIRSQYKVSGPRGLYHCDAHEKIAKLYSMWIHGCIDGYSRHIIYLRVTPDKKPETVENIFVEGPDNCDSPASCAHLAMCSVNCGCDCRLHNTWLGFACAMGQRFGEHSRNFEANRPLVRRRR